MPKKLHNALTSLQVKNAKPGRHADGGGLHLLVKPSGAQSWVYRFTLNGKTRDVGLGSAGPAGLSLAEARHARDTLRLMVRDGVDPLDERAKREAQALADAERNRVAQITFKDAAQAYIAANESGWKNPKSAQQWSNSLSTYAYPKVGDLPVGKVETVHVLRILEPIWQTKSETASRVRGRIEAILDSAKVKGHRAGENPARWKGHLEQVLPAPKKLTRGHHKAIPYSEVPAFVQRLRRREAVAALALEFTILTGLRSGAVYKATWSEVDLENRVWTVPAEHMKNGKLHRVPLSERAVKILESVKLLDSAFLFPGPRGGKMSGGAMRMLMKRMGVDATVHGFRSSLRQWAAEQSKFPTEVQKMVLSHTLGDALAQAYLRGDLFDQRRRLMDEWARHCDGSFKQG